MTIGLLPYNIGDCAYMTV